MVTYIIPCLFGLEGLVGDELRRLRLRDVQVENGRVLCRGEIGDLPRLNLNLRCGERVLLQMARFAARDFDSLFEGVKSAPWERFIPKEGQFPVKGHSLGSQLHSVPACQGIVKKAAAARLGERYGLQTLPETGAKHQIQFAIMGDEVTICLDTSGPVIVSVIGTIRIEAALIARNRAPGLDRSFDAQRWAAVPQSAWLTAAEEAMDQEFDGQYDIWGGDISPRAVEIARENARKAGVEDIVRFDQADAASLRVSGEYGQIVANPPYGQRLLEREEAEALYRAFGEVYRTVPPKWRVLILSSHPAFEKHFGRRADKKRKLYNGMIKCELHIFQRG